MDEKGNDRSGMEKRAKLECGPQNALNRKSTWAVISVQGDNKAKYTNIAKDNRRDKERERLKLVSHSKDKKRKDVNGTRASLTGSTGTCSCFNDIKPQERPRPVYSDPKLCKDEA
ncbi:uncharacterized protein BDV17DRAFT_59247 [Aspergillus undulatus]|uniref:uncharacterized protein n=1 Tax=Aspergillus undulatus TaxID=1810928 RepID=UPI003CCE3AB6